MTSEFHYEFLEFEN